MTKVSNLRVRGVSLLWLALGISCTLNAYGFSFAMCQFFGSSTVVLWAVYNADLYITVFSFWMWVVDIFFKYKDVGGLESVPHTGPIILAIAPHQNQFLDPIVVLHALRSVRSDVGWLTAAKSMRRPRLGPVLKAMNSIPVERPQDLATIGRGTICIDNTRVTGLNTKFTTDLKAGMTLVINSKDAKGASSPVLEVLNDHELKLKFPMRQKGQKVLENLDNAKYKIQPIVDHETMYKAVQETLKRGWGIGIFPEGGSHDQTKILDLKNGIAKMTLATMSKYQDLNVKIIPVGLNYYRGHRFRGNVHVEFGKPITIHKDLITLFQENPKPACTKLMQQIAEGLQQVFVEAADRDTLSFFRAMRRLYAPMGSRLPQEDKWRLMRGFASGYERVKDKPRVIALKEQISDYTQIMKAQHILDYEVANMKMRKKFESRKDLCYRLFVQLLEFLVILIISTPILILYLPFLFITRTAATFKKKKALKNSHVKIEAKDVMATTKVLTSIALFPTMHIIYTIIAFRFLSVGQATIFFFFIPLICTRLVHANERQRKLFIELRGTIMALLNPRIASQLMDTRNKLVTDVRTITKELNWGIETLRKSDEVPTK